MTNKNTEHLDHDAALVALKQFQSGEKDKSWKVLGPYTEKIIQTSTGRYFVSGYTKEDIHQHLLLKILEVIPTIQIDTDKGTLFSMLYLVCQRSIITLIKHEKTHAKKVLNISIPIETPSSTGSNVNLGSYLVDPTRARLNSVELDELRARIIELNLSPIEREAIVGWSSGEDYIQTAERIGCKKKAVDNALIRCRKKIANLKAKDEQ